MSNDETAAIEEIGFQITPEHECSYLDDKQATTLFVTRTIPLS